MTNITTKPDSLQPAAEMAVDLFDSWFDPIETEVRARAREFVEELIRGELDAVLARPRYGRSQMAGNEARAGVAGHRHGSRTRSLTGTFGPIEIAVPRARLNTPEGKTAEWKSQALRAYQRRTLAADALIASTYLAGTNTRRVRRALAALFGGAVGKDTVSRTWRKVKSDWDAWSTRSLAEEPIVRLILDGTVVRVRLDRKATSISLLVVLGVRADGQKVLLAIKSMGGESAEAWRTVLDDLINRGLRRPEFLIVDGALGLDKAIAAVWDGVPVQRCTVHKHRNLFAHAPERLHDEITADYNDMIYAATCEEIEARRKAFIRKPASHGHVLVVSPTPTRRTSKSRQTRQNMSGLTTNFARQRSRFADRIFVLHFTKLPAEPRACADSCYWRLPSWSSRSAPPVANR
jgi:putative transposase